MRALAVALISACLCRGEWIRVETPGIELFTDAGERSGRAAIGRFEQIRSIFLQAGISNAPLRLRVFLFDSTNEFHLYHPRTDGFYYPGADRDYIAFHTGPESGRVAFHEYVHMVLRHSAVALPKWFDEGFSEFYSTAEMDRNRLKIGAPIDSHVALLASEHRLNAAQLSAGSSDSAFYAESWALVHMLTLDNRYSPGFRAMVDAMKEGDTIEALRKAYGRPIEKVQQDLQAYLHGGSFNAAVFHVQLPASVDAPRIEIDASMKARLALAELLSNDRSKLDRALAAYQALSRDYENRWEIEQGWGEFLARERKNIEAVEHLARAAGLGSDDPRMYVRYARVLSMTNRDGEATGALKTALKLDPTSDDAHFELAVTLVRTGSYREALAEFHAIKHLSPEHAYRYFYHLAEAHYRVGDIAQTRLLIEKGRAKTRNPEEIAALNRLQQSLDRAKR
ncbi:MAG: hypothetical protein LAO79_21865 [Acidobacteriia bacterium]|nr:hypothetical protein [Terriglobia bacterium]